MRLTPIVAAIALATVACSSSETSAPSASSSSVGTDGGDGVSTPPVEAPAGTQAVEAANLGVGFAVPDVYTTLDPTELGAGDYQSEWFTDLASGVDIPVEQLTTALRSNLELFLFAPVSAGGFSDNVTVEMLLNGSLPGAGEVRDELEPLGVSDVDVVDDTANGIDVMRSTYVDEARDRAGYDVYFEHRGGLVVVSVTASDDEAARETGELVIETLQAVE